jgi:transporter family-2 protein
MNSASVVLMLIAGAGIAAQIAINAHLRTVSGSALWAANITFTVSLLAGLLALAAAMSFSAVALPSPALWRAPLWVWMGGLGGAVYVLLAIILAGRLGALVLSAAGIVGQLGASLLIDHYGWFGMPVQRATPARLIGVTLLAAGVVLIRWK